MRGSCSKMGCEHESFLPGDKLVLSVSTRHGEALRGHVFSETALDFHFCSSCFVGKTGGKNVGIPDRETPEHSQGKGYSSVFQGKTYATASHGKRYSHTRPMPNHHSLPFTVPKQSRALSSEDHRRSPPELLTTLEGQRRHNACTVCLRAQTPRHHGLHSDPIDHRVSRQHHDHGQACFSLPQDDHQNMFSSGSFFINFLSQRSSSLRWERGTLTLFGREARLALPNRYGSFSLFLLRLAYRTSKERNDGISLTI